MNQMMGNQNPEMKKVVVYEADTIQNLLNEMDNVLWQVRGIAGMNTICKTFETLRTQGSIQDAQLAGENGYVSNEFPMPVTPVAAGNEEVVYDADEEAVETVEDPVAVEESVVPEGAKTECFEDEAQ